MNTFHKVIRQPGTMLTIETEAGEYVCSLLGSDEGKHKYADLLAATPELLDAVKDLFFSLGAYMAAEGVNFDTLNPETSGYLRAKNLLEMIES